MALTSSARRAQAEVKASEQPLRGLGFSDASTQATLNDLEGGDWLLKCADDAINAVMQRKRAAAEMKLDAGLMTNQLNGIGHLSLRRVGLLPREFFEEWMERIRIHFKLDNDAEQLERAMECVTRGMQQIAEIARKGIK